MKRPRTFPVSALRRTSAPSSVPTSSEPLAASNAGAAWQVPPVNCHAMEPSAFLNAYSPSCPVGAKTGGPPVQISGNCEQCSTGRQTPAIDGATTEMVFARDALRMAIATERSGLDFYTRAAGLTRDPRGRLVFQKLAAEEGEHLGTLEKRYRELIAGDAQLESRPTFLFFKGAANGLFAAGADQLRRDGVDDLEALRIGIRCERGSHRFFKRYGERFEDSEGKQIFLEFAGEEREHLEMLIREYRALVKRQRTTAHKPRAKSKSRAAHR